MDIKTLEAIRGEMKTWSEGTDLELIHSRQDGLLIDTIRVLVDSQGISFEMRDLVKEIIALYNATDKWYA